MRKGKWGSKERKEERKSDVVHCYEASHSFTGKHSHCPDAGFQQRERLTQPVHESNGAEGDEERGTDLSILCLLSFDGQGLCFWVALPKHSRKLLGSLGSIDSVESYVAAGTAMSSVWQKEQWRLCLEPGGAGLLGDEGWQLRRRWRPASPGGHLHWSSRGCNL